MFENNLIASASVGCVKRTGTSLSKAFRSNISAISCPLSEHSPTTIREGYKLSYNAFPSLKNSGEKTIFSVLNFAFNSNVYPTGTVDLIIKVASGRMIRAFSITSSTVEVLK